LSLFDFSLRELVCCLFVLAFSSFLFFFKEWRMAPSSADSFNGIVTGVDQQHVVQKPIGRVVPLPEGPACVLAVATAFPPTVIKQDTYHDKLFELCNVADDVVLKAKFKRMCECTRNQIMETET
jgi:hypothetical protein